MLRYHVKEQSGALYKIHQSASEAIEAFYKSARIYPHPKNTSLSALQKLGEQIPQ
jgi:hypothetical protein